MKKNKTSKLTWKEKFNKKYNFPKSEPHSLTEISKETGVSKKGIQQIYNKGIGAYKTNPQSVRPNVTSKEQWAMARVYSSVMGGKASKVDAKELKMEMGGDIPFGYRSRFRIPNVRGGWTEKKILRHLKSYESSPSYSTYALSKFISSVFPTVEDFKKNIYYHGTSNSIKGLKPSITFSERQAERMGGGGYGERYWGISLTKRKKTAETFSGQSSSVAIYPVILKPDAKIIIREDLQDASDIEDIIVDLWNQRVDAVWIGGGEEELVVINPYAIVVYKQPERHQVFGGFKSVQPTDEEIEQTFNQAKEIYKETKEKLANIGLISLEDNIEERREKKDKINETTRSLKKLKFENGGGLDDFYKGYYERLSPSNFEVKQNGGQIQINMNKNGAVDIHEETEALSGGFFKKGGETNFNPDGKIKDKIVHASGDAGGMLVGKRHSNGGIKALNKSTGQPLEMEGGEVVITRNAVSDNKKRSFNGKMLTNRQILSEINESGGGVSFADGGQVPNDVKFDCNAEYEYGGKTMCGKDLAYAMGGVTTAIVTDPNEAMADLQSTYGLGDVYAKGGEVKGGTIECGSCSWSWDKKDGGDDMYVCHKCGADNEPSRILNKLINASDSSGRKGLVSLSALEPFVGEDRIGDSAMINSREVIDKLKIDIKKNGFKEPIIVLYDKFSNGGEATIIEGNHRFVVAKELGLKEIPVTFEKGTIRSDEKRLKDQMFPLKRKFIGKIDDTRGVRGADLGLEVRQPKENDFVKENSFAMGGKVYDYDSYTSFEEESNVNIQKGVQYILRGEYTLVARYLYLKDKEAFYYYKYLQRLNITLKDCNDFALSLNKVFSKMICDIQVTKTERKRSYAVCLVRSVGVKSPFYAQGLINNEKVSLSTPIYMECCKGNFLERISNRPIPARDLKDYYSFQTLIHELAHSLDFQFQFSENKYPVIAHKDYFMETLYNIIIACKNGSLPLAKSFGIRAKALKRISQLTKGKI